MKIRCLSCAIKNIFDCLGKEVKVYSNYLPCKEKTINVVYSNKKIVINSDLKTKILNYRTFFMCLEL